MGHKETLSVRRVCVMSTFILFSLTMICGWTWGDDQGPKTVSGRVVDMDPLTSIITVSYSDPVSGEGHEMDIMVPEETKIMNGPETITFLDIEQFDPVAVTYDGDSVNGFKAREILDLNRGNQ